ncbi:gamma-glutamyltransferase family protein [Altererythrobacter arenosus]|uniref:Gamma-glutamyltransferase family protein n=1 Tax=Altererythrobacter arenosus TaxID=3032592 RepID=A0ABY8FN35_9SPHN|nr:gamma-glutamyltransferase family protein [Altererythrobacter sp. CAU 1644]WFL76434.1 gamma-glutamyltransferase family protein [Altererythrobacter sp. CAU 1644]
MPKTSPTPWLAGLALAFAPAGTLAQEDAPPAAAERPHFSESIGQGGRPIGAAWSRSPVHAEHGMAATAHPLATQVALDVLKSGGNAVDAAIAANAALGLMEPTGNGIGGDLFAIILDPRTGRLHGINGSGRSPKGQTLDQLMAKLNGADALPPSGALPVTMPGTVDAWFAMHERFGSKPMSEILAPTVTYAREGHPVAPIIASYFARSVPRFEQWARDHGLDWSNAKETWFAAGPPQAGAIFKNPDLAETLETIGRDGRDAFYRGPLAQVMVDYLRRQGSAYTLEDFASHKSDWIEPTCVTYRDGYELCELPPNGQGFAALQMVNILKHVDLRQWERGSPEVLHYITEAKRLAYADVARYYADPEFSPFPVELLSESYGAARFALIDPARATPEFQPGEIEVEPRLEGEGDTTYMTVADKDGMMVSLIQSNYRGMGSGLTPDGLGFMFQNRGELFSLDPDHPNAYEPGKRPFQTIIPAFVKKDGKPWMSFGLMGGGMQPQGHVQILINIVDYGMDLQEAGDAARLNHDGGRQPTEPLTGPSADPLGTLHVEPGISEATIARLRAMGHKVEVVEDGIMFGGYQAIARDAQSGVYTGATEMRKDGQASGY